MAAAAMYEVSALEDQASSIHGRQEKMDGA